MTVFFFILCCSLGDFFAEANEPGPFDMGVQLYQQSKYSEAKEAFEKALQEKPDNPSILTNLALTQFQLGNKGWALALLRRAMSLDPNFSTPKAAYDFIWPQLDVKEIPHEIQFYESLRSKWLGSSLQAFLFLTALLLATSGWLWLRYWGRRRIALQGDAATPPFPTVALILTLGLALFATLSTLKFTDYFISRGTIVSEKIAAHSLPEDRAAPLFDLYPGLEVIIERTQDDWVQVTYPGGLTGWIPRSAIYHTSGRSPW